MKTFSFEKCKAENILSEELVKDSESQRLVCKYWGEYVHITETVAKSNLTKKIKVRFIDDTYTKTAIKVEQSRLPDKIKTYFANVMSTRCKRLKREIKEDKTIPAIAIL